MLVRNQFFSAIATKVPLVYKIKIESKLNAQGKWQKFDRVFKKDVKLVTDLEARLSLEQ